MNQRSQQAAGGLLPPKDAEVMAEFIAAGVVIAIVGGLIYALATSASGFAGVGSVSPNPALSGEPTRRGGHPTQRAFSLPEVGAALHVLVKSGMRGGRGLRRGSIQLASLARRGAAAASRALGALGRLRPRAATGETVELEAAYEAEEIDRLEEQYS